MILLSAAVVLVVLAVSPTPVRADPITFGYTGTVTSVNDPLGLFNGTYSVGQAITGTYTFTNTPDFVFGSPTEEFHLWLGPSSGFPPQPIGFNSRTGVYVLQYNPDFLSLPFQINVFDGSSFFGGGDAYTFAAEFTYPPFFNDPTPLLVVPAFQLLLTDPTGTALSSVSLPLTPPNLAAFSGRDGFITLFDADTFETVAEVQFQLTALQSVPEPASLAVFGLVAGGLFAARRRGVKRCQTPILANNA
jgi:hypothetical protein